MSPDVVERTDARGVKVRMPEPPRRIVSLVPSTTETLFALGLGPRVVGVTRFCVHPNEQLTGLPRVGGTKDVDPERVRALDPDWIVGNCEENSREIFAALQDIAPIWAPLPKDPESALQDLRDTGALAHVPDAAEVWVTRIQTARDVARAHATPFTYAWLIWRRPWMAAGGDTFTSALLAELGGTNVFASHDARFPEITAQELATAAPDRVLLSSEPFPFKAKHRDELAQATGLPAERFRFVDGELGTWHGVRMHDTYRAWARGVG